MNRQRIARLRQNHCYQIGILVTSVGRAWVGNSSERTKFFLDNYVNTKSRVLLYWMKARNNTGFSVFIQSLQAESLRLSSTTGGVNGQMNGERW